jgi:hypothetical protein
VKSWSALFDRDKHGVVYLFVVAFAPAQVVTVLAGALIAALFGFHDPGVSLSIQGVYIAQTVALAVLLLMTFHLVRRDWLLPLCWGAISTVLGIGTRLFLQTVNVQAENVMFPQPFDVQAILQKVPGTALRINEGGRKSASACRAPLRCARRTSPCNSS